MPPTVKITSNVKIPSNVEATSTVGVPPTVNTKPTVKTTIPKIGIFKYDELSIKNKNNRDKVTTLNSLADFVKTQIHIKEEYDLVVLCSENSILRTENHIQHILGEKLKGSKYELLSKMSINTKSILNLWGKKFNVRTRIWYNKNTINSPPEDFKVNMKNNKNTTTFKPNTSKKMNIELIERKKIYPIDTKKIKEGIGVNFTKIVISENTIQTGGDSQSVQTSTQGSTNSKRYTFIIVNSNLPLLHKNNSLSNNVSLNTISSKIKKNENNSLSNTVSLNTISEIKIENNINLIYISSNGIKYRSLDQKSNNLSYSDNNIHYFNLNAIKPVKNTNREIMIDRLNKKIDEIYKASFKQNKNGKISNTVLEKANIESLKKKFSSLKAFIDSYGYLLTDNQLKNFNKKYKTVFNK